MTNILILAFWLIFDTPTNNFVVPGWSISSNYCSTAVLKVSAPAGRYWIEMDSDIMQPSQPINGGWSGMNPLRISELFTNAPSTNVLTTNIWTVVVPDEAKLGATRPQPVFLRIGGILSS